MRIAGLSLALALALASCAKSDAKHVDLELIQIVGQARMRTDTVGEGRFAERSRFVLVDAENRSDTGAYVTLGGAFTDGSAATGALKPQSIWIPAHEVRTFALVERSGSAGPRSDAERRGDSIDADRKARPDATSAQVEVRGALIANPPSAQITDIKTFPQDGLVALQASLVNGTDRPGKILVLASFHDKAGMPLSRPFSLLEVPAKTTQPLQFVGPPGSVRGTIYIGDETY